MADKFKILNDIKYASLNRGVICIPDEVVRMLEDKFGVDYQSKLCFVVINAMQECENFENITQVCTSNPEFDDMYNELSFWYATMSEFLNVKGNLISFLADKLNLLDD